jgi:TetR/AcrR family transcriptional regulator, transcriptional repressor for nem operon
MRKGEMTRQRIIAEAAPIFNQRGFAGCSMQDLMEATGLEKGGIYRHFANKEELAAEAFRYALAQNVKLRTEHLAEVKGAVEKLRYGIAMFVETPSAIPGGCPIFNTAVDADDGNPVLRGLALEGVKAWRARLIKIVSDGLRDGEIRSGTEPRRVANMIVAALEGALMVSRLEKTRSALRDAQAMLEIILRDIGDTQPTTDTKSPAPRRMSGERPPPAA